MVYERLKMMDRRDVKPKQVIVVGNSMHQVESFRKHLKQESIFNDTPIILAASNKGRLEGVRISNELDNLTLVILLPAWFKSEAGKYLVENNLLKYAVTRETGDF